MSDGYAYWRDALAGKAPAINADAPQCGFYKMRDGKGGPWLPVAIFEKEGVLICRVGADQRPPLTVWTWCADNPVSKEDAKAAFETGRWPGDVDIGHNSQALSLPEEVEEACKQALDWLRKNGIKSQTDADMAANYRASLLALKKRAEDAHKTEKAPHLAAGRAVDEKYKPVIDTADKAGATLRVELGKFLAAEEAKARAIAEEQRKADEARVRAEMQKQAEERAKKMQADPIAALTEPEPPLPVMAPPPPPPRVSAGGQRGRVTGLKTETIYEVVDHDKALAFFAQHDDVKALIQALAKKAGKAGLAVPGVEKKIERVAA